MLKTVIWLKLVKLFKIVLHNLMWMYVAAYEKLLLLPTLVGATLLESESRLIFIKLSFRDLNACDIYCFLLDIYMSCYFVQGGVL